MRRLIQLILIISCCPIFAQPGFVWAKEFGGKNCDAGNGITVDERGNCYTTGFFQDTVDFDPGPGAFYLISQNSNWDIFVTKTDSSGNFVWAKCFGGTGWSGGQGYKIVVDKDQNVYTTGYFQGTCDFDPGISVYNLTAFGTGGYSDVFVCKLDKNGNFVWAKQLGSDVEDIGYSIEVDRNGNVYTTGTCGGNADFDPGSGTFIISPLVSTFVSKLDKNGNFIWAKGIEPYTSGPPGGNDAGYSLCCDEKENVFITGYFTYIKDFDPGGGQYYLNSSGTYNIYVWKLDINGDFVWAKQMGGNGMNVANSIKTDKNGYVYLTGQFFGTTDFDPGAGVYNLTSMGGSDVFICKLNRNGNLVWAKSLGGIDDENSKAISISSDGLIFTTGSFKGTADFDPSVINYPLSSAGDEDVFVSILDSSGNFMCAGRMGSSLTDFGNSIAANNNNIYTTGLFLGTADFDPGIATYNYTSIGKNDVFISKLSVCAVTTAISELKSNTFDLNIYPNPAAGIFELCYKCEESGNIQINIYDTKGQLVHKELPYQFNNEYRKKIDLSKHAKGIYYVEVILNHRKITKQLVLD